MSITKNEFVKKIQESFKEMKDELIEINEEWACRDISLEGDSYEIGNLIQEICDYNNRHNKIWDCSYNDIFADVDMKDLSYQLYLERLPVKDEECFDWLLTQSEEIIGTNLMLEDICTSNDNI